METGRNASAKLGLSAALLVLALLVAVQLTPASLAGRASYTETVVHLGKLLVSVTLDNGSAVAPVADAQVGISQFVLGGFRTATATNRSGEVELALQPGEYGVSVSNAKFSLSSSVTVESGNVTRLQVAANRSAYYAAFAAAQDPTSVGAIEPWNMVVLEVITGNYLIFPPLLGPGYQQGTAIFVGQNPQAALKFGETVFLQTWAYSTIGGAGGSLRQQYGREVPATVVSQDDRPGVSWLTVTATQVLMIGGAQYLMVVRYQAGSTETVFHG